MLSFKSAIHTLNILIFAFPISKIQSRREIIKTHLPPRISVNSCPGAKDKKKITPASAAHRIVCFQQSVRTNLPGSFLHRTYPEQNVSVSLCALLLCRPLWRSIGRTKRVRERELQFLCHKSIAFLYSSTVKYLKNFRISIIVNNKLYGFIYNHTS